MNNDVDVTAYWSSREQNSKMSKFKGTIQEGYIGHLILYSFIIGFLYSTFGYYPGGINGYIFILCYGFLAVSYLRYCLFNSPYSILFHTCFVLVFTLVFNSIFYWLIGRWSHCDDYFTFVMSFYIPNKLIFIL